MTNQQTLRRLAYDLLAQSIAQCDAEVDWGDIRRVAGELASMALCSGSPVLADHRVATETDHGMLAHQ